MEIELKDPIHSFVETFTFTLPEGMAPMPVIEGSRRTMVPQLITISYQKDPRLSDSGLWMVRDIHVAGGISGRRFIGVHNLKGSSPELAMATHKHVVRFLREHNQ